MKTPDITPAQVIAIVGATLGVLTAFGLDLTEEQQQALMNLTQILATVLVGADAVIRYGRSRKS